MTNVTELQTELNNSEALLAALTSERAAANLAMQTVGANIERVRDVDRRIFETRRQIMELKVSLLDLEKAPLLERLRAAQAATQVAQMAHDEAFKVLRAARQLEHDAGTPLQNNSFARLALADEIEQEHLERTLDVRAATTGKPVRVVLGTNSRAGRNQPEMEPVRG